MFHFSGILHIDRSMASIKVYDDRYRYGRFRRRDGDDENGKEDPVEPVRPEEFIKDHEIDVHAVQDQLHRHQHGDHIPSREQSVGPDEEKGRAQEQEM